MMMNLIEEQGIDVNSISGSFSVNMKYYEVITDIKLFRAQAALL